jgi:hypothetical protein
MTDTHSRPVPAGWRFLRDATPEELNGVPLPANGSFVVVWKLEDLSRRL